MQRILEQQAAMQQTSRLFYQFSGLHSLLIGILPFFIPVLLWQSGAGLPGLSLFIAITGISFVVSLKYWDQLRSCHRWRQMITISLISELLLVIAFVAGHSHDVGHSHDNALYNSAYLILAGLFNGIYNCFYWTTQRFLFNAIAQEENTAKKFGNFQILVVVLLKAGILIGGFFMESQDNEGLPGITIILMLSAAVSLAGGYLLLRQVSGRSVNEILSPDPAIAFKDVIRFSDNRHSPLIFWIDGVFLFLESYFWVLTLFFIAESNFAQLGILVVSVTLVLSLLFYFLKNRIDRMPLQGVFVVACILYGVSWLLRGQITEITDGWVYAVIVLIAFLTTFFRLVFNKQFFRQARVFGANQYIIFKSYYSQFGIAAFFTLLAIFALGTDGQSFATETVFQFIYWLFCPLSMVYLLYGLVRSKSDTSSNTITTSFNTSNQGIPEH